MAAKKTSTTTTSEAPNKHTFRFKNWGAIEELDFTVPQDQPGGVRVFMGDEGRGKSTILNSLSALADDKPRFPQTPLDGYPMGTFEAPGGVVIAIYPTRTGPIRLGQLAVKILNGQNLAMLINPGLKGTKERSRARNTALCGMLRLELNELALEAITKGDANLRKMVPPGAALLEAADLVREEANKIAVESAESAEIAGIEATSAYAAAMEINTSLEDPEGLYPDQPESVPEALEKLQAATRLAENRKVSFLARQDLEMNKEELRDVQGESPAGKLEVLRQLIGDIDQRLPQEQQKLGGLESRSKTVASELRTVNSDLSSVDEQIEELERQLAVLGERRANLQNRLMTLQDEMDGEALSSITSLRQQVEELQSQRSRAEDDRERLEEDLRRWMRRQEILDRSLDAYATTEDLQTANNAIIHNQILVSRAQQYAAALAFLESHQTAKERAQEWNERELWHRDIGWNVIPKVIADRLSELGVPGLDMRSGILYAMHETRGMIPFDDLSPGQQVRWALKIALRGRQNEELAILPFSQEGWDAMTPRAHALFRYEARIAKVWIYTATARFNGPLREENDIPEEEEAFLLELETHGDENIDAEKILIGWGEKAESDGLTA